MNIETKRNKIDIIKIKKIKDEINTISKTTLVNAYHEDNTKIQKYKNAISKIIKIGYPISLEISRNWNSFDSLTAIYNFMNIDTNTFKWLIPYYKSSNWWIEVETYDMEIFLNSLIIKNNFELTIIDLAYNFIFDSELGENEKYEIYILSL